MTVETIGDRHEVRASSLREELERTEDDVATGVIEDERRNEPLAMLLGQELERREHFDVAARVEAGEERLERAEIELGELRFPGETARLERLAEHVEVETTDRDD